MIAEVNAIQGFARRLPQEQMLTGRLAEAMDDKARECQQRGVCEERCPYHLPVRELIKENRAHYDPWLTENAAV